MIIIIILFLVFFNLKSKSDRAVVIASPRLWNCLYVCVFNGQRLLIRYLPKQACMTLVSIGVLFLWVFLTICSNKIEQFQ